MHDNPAGRRSSWFRRRRFQAKPWRETREIMITDGFISPASSQSQRERVPDLICLSHLRWNFVFQRPQHLMIRCAKERRVFFVEEPICDGGPARLEVTQPSPDIWVVVPHLPKGVDEAAQALAQQDLLNALLGEHAIAAYILWYYTPMAVAFTRHLKPSAMIYDCMDELSAFKGAPPGLLELETELLHRCDLVLTGGQSLYEAKRVRHPQVHLFPSSVDVDHFAQARRLHAQPAGQASIPRPRLGFFGVIDERIDLLLIQEVADARPDWHMIFIGPVVKIDPAQLPQGPNLHYLGMKAYETLPQYLAGWDIALLPFARNEATRFISPTKTPEYLVAGVPVVSTSIQDVVRPYGELGLVRIADTVGDFVAAVEEALREEREPRIARVDEFLHDMSWDKTWAGMKRLVDAIVDRNQSPGTCRPATRRS
jgi:UDP-galactopyranose mutase